MDKQKDFTLDEPSEVDVFMENELRKSILAAWEKKYDDAAAFMESRKGLSNKVLIEVAAQHPLVEGRPGDEFSARLDCGVRLRDDLLAKWKDVWVYVPGSIHMDNGVVDAVSLAEAGCAYMAKRGVPKGRLFGDAENEKYMGADGVYNSCDECLVASKIFIDGDFGELHCVCAPNQVMRKQLFYLQFGVLPIIHTATSANMYHQFTRELLHTIPNVIYRYPNWSDRECPIFYRSRVGRKP